MCHDWNRARRRRSVRVPAVDLRAGRVRRILGGGVGAAGAAHAADVGDQRDLLGDRGRCIARGRRRARDQRPGPHLGACARLRRAGVRLDQHLRRLPGHPAHAGDVPEEEKVKAEDMSAAVAAALCAVAGVLCTGALRGWASPESSGRGNMRGIAGVVIAVGTTRAAHPPAGTGAWILVVAGLGLGGGIGAVIARKVPMTSMPELVAAFHALVGMAAVLVAAGAFYAPTAFGIGTEGHIHTQSLIEMSIGIAIGAITFTGSVIAFLKLSGRMSGAPITLPGRHVINLALAAALLFFIYGLVVSQSQMDFWLVAGIAFVFGALIIIPIGGADMPVVISMLNSYSGWAAAGIGFTLGNSALIITGALVGSSGAILSYIMCKGMNRSFISVILGGFGGEVAAAAGGAEQRPVKIGSAEDAAYILKNAAKVIIVPGYGMAVAQAQHALREVAHPLKKERGARKGAH